MIQDKKADFIAYDEWSCQCGCGYTVSGDLLGSSGWHGIDMPSKIEGKQAEQKLTAVSQAVKDYLSKHPEAKRSRDSWNYSPSLELDLKKAKVFSNNIPIGSFGSTSTTITPKPYDSYYHSGKVNLSQNYSLIDPLAAPSITGEMSFKSMEDAWKMMIDMMKLSKTDWLRESIKGVFKTIQKALENDKTIEQLQKGDVIAATFVIENDGKYSVTVRKESNTW